MKTYLYLSLLPESLVASMLPPEEFGNYYAVGTKKRTRGQAIFFEIDPDFKSDYFPLQDIEKRCVPHPDGQPKRSVYLSIYRVLEHLPLSALKNLYLVTDDGRVLSIEKQEYQPEQDRELHLYQEITPVSPRIASNLNPLDFCHYVTDTAQPVSVPKLVFTELQLNGLATDPIKATTDNLPYPNIDHLRDCLVGLQEHPEKPTKTVIRYMFRDILYRTVKNGFFVGSQKEFFFYPFPSLKELEGKHYAWWRSALTQGFGF
ncbi:MAG: hypothetical protein GWP06_12120 [Actinobacteria bacterium]|nr:hypothetical protein [Actinomycetota bacterium]